MPVENEIEETVNVVVSLQDTKSDLELVDTLSPRQQSRWRKERLFALTSEAKHLTVLIDLINSLPGTDVVLHPSIYKKFKRCRTSYYENLRNIEFVKTDIIFNNTVDATQSIHRLTKRILLDYEKEQRKPEPKTVSKRPKKTEERTLSGRRAARRTSEFNDPSKPAHSRANRRDKQLGTSHDIELVELLNRAVSENPVGKKQLVQRGIIRALDDLGYRKDLIKLGYDIV